MGEGPRVRVVRGSDRSENRYVRSRWSIRRTFSPASNGALIGRPGRRSPRGAPRPASSSATWRSGGSAPPPRRSPRICARARQNAQKRPVVGWPHASQAMELGSILRGEQGHASLQIAEEELRLRARRRVLDRVHRLLVAKLRVAGDERALLDDVLDAPQEGVRGCLQFGETMEGLHLLHHALARRKRRRLTGDRLGLPAERVAEQGRGLVVEIVAGRDHVESTFQGGAIEDVALREPADARRSIATRACRRWGCRSRDRVRGRRYAAGPPARPRTPGATSCDRSEYSADAEPQIQTGDVVAETEKHIPEGEGVLALPRRRS